MAALRNDVLRKARGVIAAALLAGCASGGLVSPPAASVTPTLRPVQPALPPVSGHAQPVAAFRDATGVGGEFVEGFLLVRPRSAAELQRFVTRYGGEIVHDDRLPPLPPQFGIALTDGQRAPTEHLVRIDLSRVDPSRFGALARRAGWGGAMEFSSEAGLRTFTGALDARAQGFRADANFLYTDHQAFPAAPAALPLALFSSSERTAPPTDAFQQPLYGATATGSPTNVILAWQFVAAHGIQRQVRVAVIDDGFFLTTVGQPTPPDSDFAGTPLQIDLVRGTPFADGPGAGVCGGTPCPWHGTGVAGVAVGALNNNQGTAGTGSVVAVPILVKAGRTRANKNQGIRAAVLAGADVVVMSWGVICDSVACRERDREDTPFNDLFDQGNRPVFVASAGNGEGGNGFDVGAPKFYHPCIEDHVVCVGALNTGASNAVDRIQYSNFGERVHVFAPTNIPVMSFPGGVGTFGGTSASAPYVGGIAAMIKAIDPSLGSDQVGAILRETARPGVGDAKRVVDALAAVRRAAQPFAMVNDRHEPNSLDSNPTNLGAAASYAENNLNIDSQDRDLFRFNVPGGSVATISLRYASGLGAVSLFDLRGDGGACAAPAFISDTPRGDGTGRDIVYRLAGGPHVLELRGNAILAYNLGINFALPAIAADGFEPNDLVSQARYQYSFTLGSGFGSIPIEAFSPRFTIDATLHHATDVDHYIVRGVDLTGKQIGLTGTTILFNTPAVMLYGNDSRVDLQVFRLNPDGTAGLPVKQLVADSCTPEALVVPLESNVYYLVRVAGAPGRYTLHNGVDTSSRRHPIKMRDRVYEVLHPGEPIENPVRYTQYYVFPADAAFAGVSSDDPRIHLRLLEANGDVVSEGEPNGTGERLRVRAGDADRTRMLEVGRRDAGEQAPTLRLAWQPAEPSRASGNLVANPGAETLGEGTGTAFAGWTAREDLAPARLLSYEDGGLGAAAGGNPARGGTRLFAGADGSERSGLRQVVAIGPEWRAGIDAGRVKARLSALLGGRGRGDESAAAKVTYLDDRQRPLGNLALPSIGARERKGEATLVAVRANEYLPAGTAFIVVELEFGRVRLPSNDAFADNVELTLADYSTR